MMTILNNKSLVVLLTAMGIGLAHANPIGPQVAHGQASFSLPSANTLNITNSPNAIINWQGFSIQQSEVTRFIQQSANSAVLNYVRLCHWGAFEQIRIN